MMQKTKQNKMCITVIFPKKFTSAGNIVARLAKNNGMAKRKVVVGIIVDWLKNKQLIKESSYADLHTTIKETLGMDLME